MPKGKGIRPYAWTKKERRSPKMRRKIMSCTKQVIKGMTPYCRKAWKKGHDVFGPGKRCYNPIAVCRASVARKTKWDKRRK